MPIRYGARVIQNKVTQKDIEKGCGKELFPLNLIHTHQIKETKIEKKWQEKWEQFLKEIDSQKTIEELNQ